MTGFPVRQRPQGVEVPPYPWRRGRHRRRESPTGLAPVDFVGVGVVSGYGWGVEPLWTGLLTSKSAATPRFDIPWPWPDEPVWVATVDDAGDPADGRSRFARAMRASAREAVGDALARGWQPGRRVGLIHGVVLGEVDLWRDFYLSDERHVSRADYLAMMPSTPVSTLMQEFGFTGPTMNVSAMCASGNTALLMAQLWLDAGICDDVIVAATDISLTPENIRHFRELGVAATDGDPLDTCRPFQPGSRGFTMAEAAVAFVVTGRARRARHSPYVTMLGGAVTHDAYHVISIDPSGAQIMRCVTEALAAAGVAGSDVSWFNAHGPGTQQCDAAERRVVDDLLGDQARPFSLKPLLGHCQSASSAIELAVSVLAYDRGTLPAPFLVAQGHPRQVDGPVAMQRGVTVKSSVGMGGHNAVVVIDDAR